MRRALKIYILVLSLWVPQISGVEGFSQSQFDLYKAYRVSSDLDRLLYNPENHDQIISTLKDVKENWSQLSRTRMAKDILGKASKLKKLKLIVDGFNKCLGNGKNERKLALSILTSIKAIPHDNFLTVNECLGETLSQLSVINEETVLNTFAPVNYLYKRQKEKDYEDMVKTRWEELLTNPDSPKIDEITEKLESINEEVVDKEQVKRKAKQAMRDKLYGKVKDQMILMHGMFNYLLEEKNPRSKSEKVEETLKKACPGCSEEEIQKHRDTLHLSIANLESAGVKPVNTERFRNRVQNGIVELARTAYSIEPRRVYDENLKEIKDLEEGKKYSENRINYHWKPKSNVVRDMAVASEAQARFYAKKREFVQGQYGQLSEFGIVPNIDRVNLKTIEEDDGQGGTQFRLIFQNCDEERKCTNIFDREPESPMALARGIGETFGMKDFDLEKFRKERLKSIERAMGDFKKLMDEGALDEMLDKLIMHNPITAGQMLAEDPESYLQLFCERIKSIGEDEDFDENLKNVYFNITAALIIGGFVFAGPLAAAPLAGKVLMGAWYGLTGVSFYFGAKALANDDLAKASCYTGTGDKASCQRIEEYYLDKKYAILFGVMVPGSDMLRIADVATKAAGLGISVKKTFDTVATYRGRVLTFKSQGENLVDEATSYTVERSIKAVLHISDEELAQLDEAERKEIVNIIQEVYEKEGDRGVESLVHAIRTIKELEEEGQKMEKELSGKKLLDEARRLQQYHDHK